MKQFLVIDCVWWQELTKFINHCNEVKATNAACKVGGQLNIIKAESQAEPSKKSAK